MELRLDGKVALVTGASRGIGRAIASQFAQSGAKVMLSSRKPEALEQAAADIDGGRRRCRLVRGQRGGPRSGGRSASRRRWSDSVLSTSS